MFQSMFLPLRLLLYIPLFFGHNLSSYKHRYFWSLCVVLAVAICSALLELIVFGSFPLPAEKDGYLHIRFIPFIPWPDGTS